MDVQEVILTLTPLPPPGEIALALSKRRLLSPLLQRTITLSTKSSDSSYVILGRSSHNVSKKLFPATENAYFDSPNISRHHATIFIDNSRYRVLKVRDTGSLHGTYRCGERVPRDGIVLYDQDTINLGTKIIYDGDVIPPQRILVSIKWLPVSSSLKAVTSPLTGFGIQELSDSEAEITASDIPVDATFSAAASSRPSCQDMIHSCGIVDDKENRRPSRSTIQCALTTLSEFAEKSLPFNKASKDIRQRSGKSEIEAEQASLQQLEDAKKVKDMSSPSDVHYDGGRVVSWMRPLLMGFAASPTLAESVSENELSTQNESNDQNEFIDFPNEVEVEQPKEAVTAVQVEERKESLAVAETRSGIEEKPIKVEITPETEKSDKRNSSIEIIDLLNSTPVACQLTQPASLDTESKQPIENCDDQLCDAILTDVPVSEGPQKPEHDEQVHAKRRFSEFDELTDEEIDYRPAHTITSKRRRLECSPAAGTAESLAAPSSSPSTPALIGRYAAATAVGLVIGSVGTFTALLLSE
ncbi:uncharacterized protein V1513DRAFT_449823 [Lipomyces chichibuensis]|uniref:uncharacterized protein n=1 Tax=Lipomyces chichibuensis TaxID=1546026 RepID=UPI0033438C94